MLFHSKIDISSFIILNEESTGSDDHTSVGFTTDYNSLYIASKQGIHWGFSQVNTFIIAQIK